MAGRTTDTKLIGLVHNDRVPEALELLRHVVDDAKMSLEHWVSPASRIDVSDHILRRTSAIITAGGDGTILRVSRIAAPFSIPILGINMGRVGFMTELTVEESAEKLWSYIEGKPRIEKRMMLQATVASRSGGEPHILVHALNDVVVSRGEVARLLDIETRVDGAPLYIYRADGLIVATATGSTGYALSAGGPIIYPEARTMLIQPLAAHMSFDKGVVVSGDSVIELTTGGDDDAILAVDGFTETTLRPEDKVVVQRSPHVARFLREDPPARFYAALTRRLGIAGRAAPSRKKRQG